MVPLPPEQAYPGWAPTCAVSSEYYDSVLLWATEKVASNSGKLKRSTSLCIELSLDSTRLGESLAGGPYRRAKEEPCTD